MEGYLAVFVTVYGIIGALSSLLQVRRMLQTRSSGDISVAFLIIYSGGYLAWLAYGLATWNLPLILVDLVGLGVSGIALYTALGLRMKERGQTFKEALKEERQNPASHLTWLSALPKARGKKPELKDLEYNRLYPVAAPLPSEVTIESPTAEGFYENARLWRALEHQGQEVESWRQMLMENLEHLPDWPQGSREAVEKELARPLSEPPVKTRIAHLRAASLAAWASQLTPDTANQVVSEYALRSAGYLSRFEYVWLEQLLASSKLHQTPGLLRLDPNDYGFETSKPLAIAPDQAKPSLFPLENGVSPTYGTVDPLILIPVANQDNLTAIHRVLALSTRPQDPQLLNNTRPLDRSLHEGYAALMLSLRGHDYPELYPLERAALSACAKRAGCSATEMIAELSQVDVSETSRFLAGIAKLPLEALASSYEKNFLRLYRSSYKPHYHPQQLSLAFYQALFR